MKTFFGVVVGLVGVVLMLAGLVAGPNVATIGLSCLIWGAYLFIDGVLK